MRRLRGQDGQSLVVVIAAMFLILVIAAVAIDVSQWYQKRHQAQVAADAAALAAANYMGNGGDAASATNTATSYASGNSIPITSGNVTVDTSAENVTVTTSAVAPVSFASVVGLHPSVSARAVASWRRKPCSSAGSSCAFIYAGDTRCGSPTPKADSVEDPNSSPANKAIVAGVTINQSGTSGSPQGWVISDSNIDTTLSGNATSQWNPPANAKYSNQTNCAALEKTTSPPYKRVFSATPSTAWPIDYSQLYPACSGSACSGPGGTPSYCDLAAPSFTNPTAANKVYCAYGSSAGVDPRNPSTWTGSITQANPLTATYICGTAKFGKLAGGTTSGPASGNNLWIYAAESNSQTGTSPAVDITTNGTTTMYGDVFAPVGTIAVSAGGNISASATTQEGIFLEGYDVVYDSNGTVAAGGPLVDSNGNFIADTLTQ